MSIRYNKQFLKTLATSFVMILMLGSINLNATHIVGSDMSFRCLGQDYYEVTLTVRRDCINGAEDAPFDDPASVGIFDAAGNPLNFLGTIGQVMIPLADVRVIDPGMPECGFFGGGICVEEATYVGRVYLPFRKKGYVLAYQRCCRNVTLNNIIDPLETGTSKFVCLTEETLTSCNSSPTFGDWPEMIICANQPLTFEHPAFDADGDSLSYQVYTPHTGASRAWPRPQPPRGPQYDTLRWATGYDLNNLMGGVPFEVDPVTGRFTATPNTVGQFLIGVMVTEWRDGKPLSMVWRDFEYNVRVCQDIAGINFDIISEPCSGLTVTVDNTSADDHGYTWNFNYPSTDPQYISTEREPVFTYPQEGVYTISLSSTHPETGCESLVTKELPVFNQSITAELSCTVAECVDGMSSILLNVDASDTHPQGEIIDYKWVISTANETLYREGNYFVENIECGPNDNVVEVSLTIESSTGCTYTISKAENIPGTGVVLDPTIEFVDNGRVCRGNSVLVVNNPNPEWTYTWSPVTGLSFDPPSSQSNPLFIGTESQTYSVTVSNGTTSVVGTTSIEVVDSHVDVSTSSTAVNACTGTNGSASVINNTSDNYRIEWNDSPYILSGRTGFTVEVGNVPNGVESVTLGYRIFNENGCYQDGTIAVAVEGDATGTNLLDNISSSLICGTYGASLTSTGATDGDIRWSYNGVESTDANPTFDFGGPGTYSVRAELVNGSHCGGDTVRDFEIVIPEILTIDTDDELQLSVCESTGSGETQTLTVNTNGGSVTWTDQGGSIIGSGNSIDINPQDYTGNIIATVSDDHGCEASVVYSIDNPIGGLDVVINNGDGDVICLGETFPVSLTGVSDDSNLTYEWSPAEVIVSGQGTADAVAQISETTEIKVIVTDPVSGCSATFTVTPEVKVYSIVLNQGDIQDVCPGQEFDINVITDGELSEDLVYTWEPAESIIGGQGTANITTSTDGNTEYTVTVEDPASGCTQVLSVIPAIRMITAETFADPDAEILYGESVTITADSPDDVISYQWDNGVDGPTQIVSPTVNTDYTVTVTDADGCVGTSTITVTVIEPPCTGDFVYLPTAFSPNGDGENDVLLVRSNFVQMLDLQVVDRWGEEVFHSTNQRDGWNGTYKNTGRQLEPDIYAYCLKVVCLNGEPYFEVGNVQLYR